MSFSSFKIILSIIACTEEQRLEAIDRREREKRELMDAPSGYIWGRNEVSRRDPRKRVMDSDSDTYTSHISDSGFTSIAAQMRKSGYEPPVPIVSKWFVA